MQDHGAHGAVKDQPATFGTTAAFTLSLTTNIASGGIPDSFSFLLLDRAFVPYASTGPPHIPAGASCPSSPPAAAAAVRKSRRVVVIARLPFPRYIDTIN